MYGNHANEIKQAFRKSLFSAEIFLAFLLFFGTYSNPDGDRLGLFVSPKIHAFMLINSLFFAFLIKGVFQNIYYLKAQEIFVSKPGSKL